MTYLATLGVSVTAILVFAASPVSAAYSCKGDKRLDVPMQFNVAVEGAGRVHVSAYGGADKSGYVAPSVWRLYDANNRLVDSFPRSVLVFVSPNMLRETTLDGLVPGQSYTIELGSVDFCGRAGAVRVGNVATPAASGSSNPPDLGTPTTVQVGLQSALATQIQFSLAGEPLGQNVAGLQRVTVSINGTLLTEFNYANGVNVRWWCQDYPSDGLQSVLEGPYYYVSYPDTYRGTYSYVEVVAIDVDGHESRQGAWLSL